MSAEQVPQDFFEAIVHEDGKQPARKTLSFSRSTQILVSQVVNRTNRLAIDPLKNGPIPIGMVEFKMLVNLARYPGSTVASNTHRVGIDKGAISRSLSKMEQLGLVESKCSVRDERRKEWFLTSKGYDLHDFHINGNLQFQLELLDGFSLSEVKQLNGFLERILENIETMAAQTNIAEEAA